MSMTKNGQILTVPSLQNFFFDVLQSLNQNISNPLPEQAIFYSSAVLERYSLSQSYFENIDGKIQEKVLGMKMLEAVHRPPAEREKIYRDVAETTLILCGCFASSLKNKLVGTDYYYSIGKMAYSHMDRYIPTFMDMPSFFDLMSRSFETVTKLMDLMAKKNSTQTLIESTLSEQDAAILGITLVGQDKIS